MVSSSAMKMQCTSILILSIALAVSGLKVGDVVTLEEVLQDPDTCVYINRKDSDEPVVICDDEKGAEIFLQDNEHEAREEWEKLITSFRTQQALSHCEGNQCSYCMPVISDYMCIRMVLDSQSATVKISLKWKKKNLISASIPKKSQGPICASLMMFLRACLDVKDVSLKEGQLGYCVRLKFKLHQTPWFSYNIGCYEALTNVSDFHAGILRVSSAVDIDALNWDEDTNYTPEANTEF